MAQSKSELVIRPHAAGGWEVLRGGEPQGSVTPTLGEALELAYREVEASAVPTRIALRAA